MTPLVQFDREMYYPEVTQNDEEEPYAPNATHVTTRPGYPRSSKSPEMNSQVYHGHDTSQTRASEGRRVTYSDEGAATRTQARQLTTVYPTQMEERTELRGHEATGTLVTGDGYRGLDPSTPSTYNTVQAEYNQYGPSTTTPSRHTGGQMTLTNRQRAEDAEYDNQPGMTPQTQMSVKDPLRLTSSSVSSVPEDNTANELIAEARENGMILKGPWELTVWLVRVSKRALEQRTLQKSAIEPLEKLISTKIIGVLDYEKITMPTGGSRPEYPDPCVIWKQLSAAYNACVPHQFTYLFFCIEKIPSEKLIKSNEQLIRCFVMGTLGYHLLQLNVFTTQWLHNLPDMDLKMTNRNFQFTGTTAMEQLY
jgi:hypothetical protein